MPNTDTESNEEFASESEAESNYGDHNEAGSNYRDHNEAWSNYGDLNDTEDYFQALDSLSKLWLSIQLTHNVSLAAAYEFWKVALIRFPKLLQLKESEEITRKVPQFVHLLSLIHI